MIFMKCDDLLQAVHYTVSNFSILESVMRPFATEFLAVFLSFLSVITVDVELTDRHVSFNEKTILIALFDATTAFTFLAAFQT